MIHPPWFDVLKAAGYPTGVVVLDFETYFSVDYSLAKLSTVEFVQDPRFEVLCLSAHIQGQPFSECQPNCWIGGEDVAAYLRFLQREYGPNLERCTVVAQNAYFEAAVLAWRYDIRPAHFIDTAGLHRHIDARGSHRLKDMAEAEGLTPKGDTSRFKSYTFRTRKARPKGRGKARKIPKLEPKLHGQILDDLVEYANHDVRLEWELFTRYLPRLSCPAFELKIMQHTLDIWTTPRLAVDYAYGEDLARRMDGKIDELVEPTGLTRDEISGNKTFEAALTEAMAAVGETPPVKPKKGGGTTLCLAKDDPERDALLHHRDLAVRQLVEARVGVKSWPNHVKRVRAIMAQCRATGDRLCVPLRYHGAHCLTGDHEVLTPGGWVRLDEWGGGRIMQWEPGGSLRFAAATANRFHNDEPMVRLNAGRVRGLFTAGHQLPSFSGRGHFAVRQAGEHPHMARFPLAGRRVDRGCKWRTRLVVAIQADGCWLDKRRGRKLRFGFRKLRKLRRIVVILRRLSIPYDVRREKSGTYRVCVRLPDLPAWLPYGRKSLGEWGLSLDSGTVAREVPHWDGNYEANSVGWAYTSCDRASAEWVQTHAHISGYAASLRPRRRGHEKWSDSWRVFVSPCATVHIRPHHWTDEPAVPEVYCPSTETGYFLCRYESTIFVSHNTGRWSGGEGINLQSLPARSPEPIINEIRGMLVAPPGFKLVVADASQIEARVLAWEAGQEDLIQRFATGEEIYAGFASRVLGWKVRKPRPSDPPALAKKYAWARNAVGKVAILGCLAEGTPVLTDNGWKPIEGVCVSDRVWDGGRWVRHAGVIPQGRKQCIEVEGVWMTPDHEIAGEGGWFPAHVHATNNPLRASDTASGRWKRLYSGPGVGSSVSSVAAPAVEQAIRAETAWSPGSLHVVMRVLRLLLDAPVPAGSALIARNRIVRDFSTELVRSLAAAKHDPIADTANAASVATLLGCETARHFYATLSRFPVGMIRPWRLTESTMTAGMNLGTSDSSTGQATSETLNDTWATARVRNNVRNAAGSSVYLTTGDSGKSIVPSGAGGERAVYDILLAGPHQRFQAGPLLVSNCGYSMGAEKVQATAGGAIDIKTAYEMVKQYRTENDKIVQYWSDLEDAFACAARYGKLQTVGHVRIFPEPGHPDVTVIELPSGRWLRYRARVKGVGYNREISVQNTKTKIWGHTYGGSLTENVVQAMARDLLAGSILAVEEKGYPVVLTVHDELVGVVPEPEADAALAYMVESLSTPPAWAEGCPLAAEGSAAKRYGK